MSVYCISTHTHTHLHPLILAFLVSEVAKTTKRATRGPGDRCVCSVVCTEASRGATPPLTVYCFPIVLAPTDNKQTNNKHQRMVSSVYDMYYTCVDAARVSNSQVHTTMRGIVSRGRGGQGLFPIERKETSSICARVSCTEIEKGTQLWEMA